MGASHKEIIFMDPNLFMMKSHLYYLLIIMTICSCSKNKNNSAHNDVVMVLNTDQTQISYRTCGSGDIAVLFVHGWNINKSYWSAQFDEFCGDYNVISMDLPGFGESKNLEEQYAITSYAKDVRALMDHLELNKVVLVGHSMGGRIILEAAQNNDRVIAMVGVDNFKEVDQEITEELKAEMDRFLTMLNNDFSETSSAYADQYLIYDRADSAVRRRIVQNYSKSNPESSIAAIAAYFNYEYTESERLTGLKLPLYLISSHMFPLDTLALDNTGLDYHVFGMDQTGHFPMVEQPEVFNKHLTEILVSVRQRSE